MYSDREAPQHNQINQNKYAFEALKLMQEEPIFLDTETTGLDESAEIVEIALIDLYGQVLLNTLIKPYKPIPKEATSIHGITNDMVKDAPTWAEVQKIFQQIIKNRPLIIYNRNYDVRIIDQTVYASLENKSLHESDRHWDKGQRIYCAMKMFAAYYGEWDTYRKNCEEWECCENCGGTGMDSSDYNQMMHHESQDESDKADEMDKAKDKPIIQADIQHELSDGE